MITMASFLFFFNRVWLDSTIAIEHKYFYQTFITIVTLLLDPTIVPKPR